MFLVTAIAPVMANPAMTVEKQGKAYDAWDVLCDDDGDGAIPRPGTDTIYMMHSRARENAMAAFYSRCSRSGRVKPPTVLVCNWHCLTVFNEVHSGDDFSADSMATQAMIVVLVRRMRSSIAQRTECRAYVDVYNYDVRGVAFTVSHVGGGVLRLILEGEAFLACYAAGLREMLLLCAGIEPNPGELTSILCAFVTSVVVVVATAMVLLRAIFRIWLSIPDSVPTDLPPAKFAPVPGEALLDVPDDLSALKGVYMNTAFVMLTAQEIRQELALAYVNIADRATMMRVSQAVRSRLDRYIDERHLRRADAVMLHPHIVARCFYVTDDEVQLRHVLGTVEQSFARNELLCTRRVGTSLFRCVVSAFVGQLLWFFPSGPLRDRARFRLDRWTLRGGVVVAPAIAPGF